MRGVYFKKSAAQMTSNLDHEYICDTKTWPCRETYDENDGRRRATLGFGKGRWRARQRVRAQHGGRGEEHTNTGGVQERRRWLEWRRVL